ncbi:MAG: CAP domain-containing protein [Actinobacteria bacterium]|nr:CAP domain-containing protein [Actinomycetota bacterium]
MSSKKVGRRPKIKLSLVLGIIVPIMIFGLYFGYTRIFSNNINNINAIFSGESLYVVVDDISYSEGPGLLLMVKADILADIEKQDSIDEIDTMVSDSVKTESKLINEQRLKEEKAKSNTPVENMDDQANQDNTDSSSTQEVAAVQGVSYVESQMIHLINSIRSSHGLQLLNPNPVLNSIARSRSQDMLNRGYFSHYTPEGKNIFNILVENGIMYACGAENLSQASPPSWGSPEAVVNNWMSSSAHRANMLNPHFGQLGLGVMDSGNRRVITLIFINR